MDTPKFTDKRIVIAFTIAVVADLIEFPITYVEYYCWPSLGYMAGAVAVLMDCCVMAALTKLLGFHWLFLPAFCTQAVPKLDMFPTWVGCVAFIVWQNKKQQQPESQSPPLRPIIDVQEVKAIGASLVRRLAPPQLPTLPARVEAPPPLPPALGGAAFETRLAHLNELRDKNLISESEYDTKRQQILAEI